MAKNVGRGGYQKKKSPQQRASVYPDDLMMFGDLIMCKFCNTELSNNSTTLKNHVEGKNHKEIKQVYNNRNEQPLLQQTLEAVKSGTSIGQQKFLIGRDCQREDQPINKQTKSLEKPQKQQLNNEDIAMFAILNGFKTTKLLLNIPYQQIQCSLKSVK